MCPAVQRLQSPPLNAPPNGLRGCAYGCVDGPLDGGISALRNDARKATQNNFDETLMIDAAFRPVDVGQAHGDPLDRGRELAKPHPEFSCDGVAILAIKRRAKYSYVSRRLYLTRSSPCVFDGAR